MKQFKSVQKYYLMSPRKLRTVASSVKGLSPKDAVSILKNLNKRSAKPILKVIMTAMANAKLKGVSEENLVIKELQISEGPRLKRGTPVSKGRWHPYQRKMSHIRVILREKEIGAVKKPSEATDGGKIQKDKNVDQKSPKVLKTLRSLKIGKKASDKVVADKSKKGKGK
jgi:large subunit ribosomal protein L22